MPCYDPRSHEPTIIYRSDPRQREVADRLSGRLNKLTSMLCGLCTNLESDGLIVTISPVVGLPEWWAQHKAFDAGIELIKAKPENMRSIDERRVLKEHDNAHYND